MARLISISSYTSGKNSKNQLKRLFLQRAAFFVIKRGNEYPYRNLFNHRCACGKFTAGTAKYKKPLFNRYCAILPQDRTVGHT
jgi:hypothetical protein